MDGRYPGYNSGYPGGFNPGYPPNFNPSRGHIPPDNYGRADLDPMMVNPRGNSAGMFMDPRDLRDVRNPGMPYADDRQGQVPRNYPVYPAGPRPEDLYPRGPGGSVPPGANYFPTSPFDIPPEDRNRGWTPYRANPNPDHFRPPF